MALPACSCLSLAKELLGLLAPWIAAPRSDWGHDRSLAALGLDAGFVQALLEHRFRLRLALLHKDTRLGELLDQVHQGLSVHPIAPPTLC